MAQERQQLNPFSNYEEWYWDRFGHEPTREEVEIGEAVLARDERFVRSFSVQLKEGTERSIPKGHQRFIRYVAK